MKLPISTILVFFLLCSFVVAFPFEADDEECNRPFGLESGELKDAQITASSAFDPLSTGPQHARVRTETGSGGWCPKNQINASSQEWIQIELSTDSLITAIETQGRHDSGRGVEYAKTIMIEYWRESLGHWARYRDANGNEILNANSDPQTPVLDQLSGGFVAKLVRIIPISEQTRTVCLRLELYGCPFRIPVRDYAMPQGSSVGALDFRDSSYDGEERTDGRLHGGIGRLFDGTLGEDDFNSDQTGWIGWNRAEMERRNGQKDIPKQPTITIDFHLKNRQNLSAVSFHVANRPKSGVFVFSTARLLFGVESEGQPTIFSNRALRSDEQANEHSDHARWIRIPVPNRLCSVLRAEFTFASQSEWILMSEVRIESTSAPANILYADEELDGDPLINPNTLTYIAISNEGGDDGETIRWMIIGIVAALTFGCLSLCVLLHLLFSSKWAEKRKRAPSSSPQMTKSECGGPRYVQPFTQSRYDSGFIERGSSTTSDDAEYAEPDVDSMAEPLLKMYTHTNYVTRSTLETGPKSGVEQPLSTFERYAEIAHRPCEDVPLAEFDPKAVQTAELLGRGDFGELRVVGLVENPRMHLLLHVASADDRSVRGFHRRCRAVSQLSHQNICRFLGVLNEADGRPAVVFDSPAHGPLPAFFHSYPPENVHLLFAIGTQIAAGCSYLEAKSFIHRDLAARSVLIDADGIAKISDFAIADSTFASDYVRCEDGRHLALRWSPPEVVSSNAFSSQSDCYSLGITLMEVFNLCAERPFDDLNDCAVFGLLRSSSPILNFSRPPHCPSEMFEQVILPCLHVNPSCRPSMAEVHRRLQTALCQVVAHPR